MVQAAAHQVTPLTCDCKKLLVGQTVENVVFSAP